eukprot:1152022-Pelagomonas_calceolata.AAC.1
MSITATSVRQPNQLIANQQHVHSVEVKYCEDPRPGQQSKAAQRQHAHADICKNISGKAVTSHTILLVLEGLIMKTYHKKKKGEEPRRQREHSLHQSRKRRHIGSKRRESPSPEGKREASGSGGFLEACSPRAIELC